MAIVLMVAEKPSLAKSLAEILSHKTARSRKSSCSACSVYEYDGQLPLPSGGAVSAKFKMTSVCGHVLSLDFQPKYNNWDETDPVTSGILERVTISMPQVDLYQATTIKKEAVPSLRICNFLRQEVRLLQVLCLIAILCRGKV